MKPIECRLCTLDEIITLRHDVLIAGTDRTSDYFSGDALDSTLHAGAFAGKALTGCASWMLNEWDGKPTYQLRGMATHPDWQGQGIGNQLLKWCESYIVQKGVHQVWCNARTPAVSFYEKQGWKTIDSEFMIEGVGPHYKMHKTLFSGDY